MGCDRVGTTCECFQGPGNRWVGFIVGQASRSQRVTARDTQSGSSGFHRTLHSWDSGEELQVFFNSALQESKGVSVFV